MENDDNVVSVLLIGSETWRVTYQERIYGGIREEDLFTLTVPKNLVFIHILYVIIRLYEYNY